jgi:membrane protein involved in D-alanine export
MIPFTSFQYFAILLLYITVPTLLVRLCNLGGRIWVVLATLLMLAVQYHAMVRIGAGAQVREIWVVLGYAGYTLAIAYVFLLLRRGGKRFGAGFASVMLCLAPLAVVKFGPLFSGQFDLGFLGISYVTFRALDMILAIQDGVLKSVPLLQTFAFLLFFPTISSGPIDRFRRFDGDWKDRLGRRDLLDDLDAAVRRIFDGFFYKFIIAYLIARYWMDTVAARSGFWGIVNYMYAYTLYLFFDFAGYSHFAIGVSRLFGIRTPENFNAPFLAVNIRDFWNRWHMTLSFWFRDHVFMRFALAATRGKWFRSRHTASYLGFLLSFGLMGLWHGVQWYFLVYGLYHAALLIGHDLFARWRQKPAGVPGSRLWKWMSILITFNFVCFGFLLFSGRLSSGPILPAGPNPGNMPASYEGTLDSVDANTIEGWVWDPDQPDVPLRVDIYDGEKVVATVMADKFRDDLYGANKGNGRHGLTVPLPDVFKDGRRHSIGVKVSGTDYSLNDSPQNFTFVGSEP